MSEQKTEAGNQPTQCSEFIKQMMAARNEMSTGENPCNCGCGPATETAKTEK